ncbi:helix-turn-helix domain-containing protein [Mesorhizobium sp.]|nr:helix-turn-helix domain-containing protein [Mesorhizobium sp.]
MATGPENAEVVGVLRRWEDGDLSMMEAGELLGMSERQFRRYRHRYEEAGEAGLLDRRLGKISKQHQPQPVNTKKLPIPVCTARPAWPGRWPASDGSSARRSLQHRASSSYIGNGDADALDLQLQRV